MAVYKIFPEKSATLYSFSPTLNTGLDEIIELSTFESIFGTNEVARPIIKFPTNEIGDIFNKIGTASFDCYLNLYLANASELPLDYTIYSHPLATDWNVGTGRLGNSPITIDGASWGYKDENNVWFSGFPVGTTGSYNPTGNIGGGLWWTGSNYIATQSFNQKSSKDIELKVTNIVNAWNSGSISNYGFILKHSDLVEFTTASKFETKYFSGNTHTIYPPCLEIRWNDSVYNTGSQAVINSDLYVTSIGNNKKEYQQDSVQRFRVKVRAKYPPRTFALSSFSYNLNNYVLPSTSYWSIKDLDTEEIVIDYDENYTKISCNLSGSYFDVYMNGLEPERYYKLLFKSILSNGETIIFDENYYFKVIR
jgi:small nuclear ribonucleoprotein (snRNP)-like protein